jgi:hypothetical protein
MCREKNSFCQKWLTLVSQLMEAIYTHVVCIPCFAAHIFLVFFFGEKT